MHSGKGTLAALVSGASLLVSLSACVSTQQVSVRSNAAEDRQAPEVPRARETPVQTRVNRLDLSATHAEVGKPFRSRFVVSGDDIKKPQYAIHPVPPGLEFDAAHGTLRGVPEQPGFYRLTIAVRERPEDDIDFGRLDRRWFTEEVELAVYAPIEEDE